MVLDRDEEFVQFCNDLKLRLVHAFSDYVSCSVLISLIRLTL